MALAFHCTLMDLIPEGQGRHCCSSSHVHVAVDLPQVDEPVAAAAQLPNIDEATVVTRRKNLMKGGT